MFLTLLQISPTDGFYLNLPTLGVISSIVLGLVGGLTYLFKKWDLGRDKQIESLTVERDALLEKLFDVVKTGERTADAGEEAAKLLLRRAKAGRSS
jgi:hypothetical protein